MSERSRLWMGAGPWLLALLAVAVPLLIGQQVPARLTQELGAPPQLFNVTGLGAPEQGEAGPFRWNVEPDVSMALQPLGHPFYATLHVQGVRPADQPAAQLGAQAAGRSLGVYELPRSPSTVEVRLPAAALFSINPRLEITTTLFQPPSDRRFLGVVFYRVEQSTGPFPAWPAPWPGAALLISGLLVYAAAHGITRQPRAALAVTLAWGLALGALNAGVRPWLVFYSWYFVVPPLIVWLLTPWVRGVLAQRAPPLTPDPSPHEVGRGGLDIERGELSTEPDITDRPWPLALAVTAAALIVLAGHLIAPLVPSGSGFTDNITWGLAFYGALPWPLQALGIGAVLAALAWAWTSHQPSAISRQLSAASPQSEDTQHATRNTQHATRKPSVLSPQSSVLPWLLAGGAVLVCSLFPVAYSEGDSEEFDQKIPKGAIWRERELLDFYLKARLWRLLEAWLPRPSQIYALVATLAGGVYVAGAWLLGRALGRTQGETLALLGALLATGNILLFFGYVESYALVQVASLFVLWACWQYTQGRLSFGAVGAFATLAPLFHGSALWWGPMVLAAWLGRTLRQPRATRWRTALREGAEGVAVGLAIMLVVISVALIDGYDYERFLVGLAEMGGADGRTMMPLLSTQTVYEHYPYFSWAHLGAVVQEQLLIAPLALLTLGIVAAFAWPGLRRLARAVPGVLTLAVGAAGLFFYSTTWNPDLGPRDDWDLLSLAALPLTLLAVYLLLHLPSGRPRRLALAAYLSVSAVHAAAWVVLHVLGIRA